MVHAAPDPRLDGYVLDYCAYDERTASFTRRRELPSDRVVMIVNLGEPIRVLTDEWSDQPDGFLAGMHDTFAVTETSGAQRGVQIDLSPVGAHLLLRHADARVHGPRRRAVGAVRARRARCCTRRWRARRGGRRSSTCSTSSSSPGSTTRSRPCRA